MMKKVLALIFSMVFQIAIAQQIAPEMLEKMQFRNIGPAGMSGRIAAIDVDPTNDNRIFAGAASGGLWLSENGGQSWQCIFNNEKVASIGAVKIDPANPSIIWVGTGEGNPRNSQTSGGGVYKSIDGGRTWQFLGLEETKNIHRILVDPRNSNIAYVAAIGVAWGENAERGVYKTTDGGKNWKKVLYTDARTGAADLVIDPKNPNKLMAAMWQYRRWPWFFTSGGPSSGLYVSHDGGENWQKRTEEDGLPKGDLGRMGLAIAPSNPQIVYALIENKEKNALFRSEDGGFKWQKVSDDESIGNRPFYYADIYVDPVNHNRIYSLWTLLTMSEDGGKSWKTIAPYSSVHPDHHAFWVGKNPNYLIEGNDGGLNISKDGGQTWRFVENLPLAQFYHISVDNQLPYNIYGGMQDNGSWRGPAYVWHAGGIRNSDWEELYFGDGFDVVPDPSNNRYVYAQSQEGYVGRVDVETGYSKLIRPLHPNGEKLRFNWNAAIAQDPFSNQIIYFGSQFLHKSDNQGDSWQIISPDLTTNDTAHQNQLQSGGLTYDVTGAENYTTIITIAPSTLAKDEIWVGTDDGNVQLTRDGGKSWQNLSKNIKDMPAGAWVAQIQVSTHKKGAAFVVINDYRRNNWEPYLFYTQDYGKTFMRLANANNVDGYAMSVIQDSEVEKLLFLGTERGLYYSIDAGKTWTKWGKDFPTVQVSDLVIQPREADLVVGTFGRAAWVLDDIRPLRALAQNKEDVTTKPITCFDAPDAYNVAWKQANGTRFAADAMYKGDNRNGGARLSFWITPQKNDTAFNKIDKVTVKILDERDSVMRTWQAGFVPGLNRIGWDLHDKGVRYPSLTKPDEKALKNDPQGVAVLPGTYRFVISYGKYIDTAMVAVNSDPRLNISATDLAENRTFKKALLKQVEAIYKVAQQLGEAKAMLSLWESELKLHDDKEHKELQKLLKATSDSLELVRLAIFGKENVKGYFEQPETWASVYGQTMYALGSNRGAISENNRLQAQQLIMTTQDVINLSNAFFLEDWQKLIAFLQENPISLLNKFDAVQIK